MLFLGFGAVKLLGQVLYKCELRHMNAVTQSIPALGCDIVRERALGPWFTWPHLQKAT